MPSPERNSGSERKSSTVEHKGAIEHKHMREHEPVNQEAAEKEIENARKEALGKALEEKDYNTHDHSESDATGSNRMSGVGLKQGFDRTMGRVRADMPLPQRIFSKVIHYPAVEKTSDLIGSTVARPDAILSGSLVAFVLTTALYFTAKYYGFSLSGSETIATFIIGWLIGLLFDLVKRLFRR